MKLLNMYFIIVEIGVVNLKHLHRLEKRTTFWSFAVVIGAKWAFTIGLAIPRGSSALFIIQCKIIEQKASLLQGYYKTHFLVIPIICPFFHSNKISCQAFLRNYLT